MTALTTSPLPPRGATSAPSRDERDDLVGRLELVFRLLGKRVYLPGLRALRAGSPNGAGVDKAGYPLLTLLEEHDEVRPSDAAVALELDLSTVSRQVRHLEQSGLVTRRPDDDDGRACRVRLTPEGRDGLAAVRRTRAQLLDRALGSWSPADRQGLLHLLDRLLTDLHGTATSGPANTEASTSTSETPGTTTRSPHLIPALMTSTPETDR